MFNKLLNRQIHKYFGNNELSENQLGFLKLISATYDHYDQDRIQLERSIEISSEEMIELNETQRKINLELRTLFETIQEVFFSVGFPGYELLQMSPACVKVYGYTNTEFSDNPKLWYDVIVEEDRHINEENNVKMLAGISFTHTHRIHHKNGSIRWVETRITPTLNNGVLSRIDGITTDITDRKIIEEKLYASEQKFRSLIENNADMISMMDENGNFLYLSPAVPKTFGYTSDEAILRKPEEIVYPDDLQILGDFMQTVFQNPNIPLKAPAIRNLRKDGSYIWVEGTITNLLNNQSVNAIVANFRDITERKRSEEKIIEVNENLQLNIDRLNQAQTIAKVGSWMQDLKLNSSHYTPEFFKIFEITPDELPQSIEEFLLFFHEDDRSKIYDNFIQRRIDFKSYQYEARLLLKNNRVKYIVANGNFETDKNGKLVKLHGTVQDITSYKRVELELEKNLNKLQKTNSELDKFVYSVSHDLRAPLSSMLGIIDITEDNTNDEFVRDHLQILKTSINKLDGFIGDILDYSRNSRLNIKPEKIYFKELLDVITKNLKYIGANNRMVDITYDIKGNNAIISDKSRISIILNNLISNSIKYQNPNVSNPFVIISINASSAKTSITVTDNGIGIDPDYINKIFDMFYRIDKNSIGSGLGLYIVKESINKLNGVIKVKSEKNKGTTFLIEVPNN